MSQREEIGMGKVYTVEVALDSPGGKVLGVFSTREGAWKAARESPEITIVTAYKLDVMEERQPTVGPALGQHHGEQADR